MPQYEETGIKTIQGVDQWSLTAESGTNLAKTLTKAGVNGQSHHITAFEVSLLGASAANDIKIKLQDGTTTVWEEVIGSGAPRGERSGVVLFYPITISEGSAVNLVVDAGGAGVVTVLNMAGYTI